MTKEVKKGAMDRPTTFTGRIVTILIAAERPMSPAEISAVLGTGVRGRRKCREVMEKSPKIERVETGRYRARQEDVSHD